MEHSKNITKEPAKSYKLQIQRLFQWQSREGAQPRLGHSQTETAGQEPLGMPLHPAKRLGGKEEANSGTANYHSCHSQELGDLEQQADLYRSGQTQNQARIRQEHQPLQEHTDSTSEDFLGGPQTALIFHKGDLPTRAYRLRGRNAQGSTTTVSRSQRGLDSPPPTHLVLFSKGRNRSGGRREEERVNSKHGRNTGGTWVRT